MKSPKLNPADFAVLRSIVCALCEMNARNDINANDYGLGGKNTWENRGTYGHLWRAVAAFVLNQTDVDISNADWWLDGDAETSTRNIQEAIFQTVERTHCDERQRVCESCPEGNLTLSAVRDALKAQGVRIMRDTNRTDYVVSIKGESAAQWFISSSLLECFEQGQRKALCALSGRAYVSPY